MRVGVNALDEINEIVERHPERDDLMPFVSELTEYFDAVDIVLILRSAEQHSVI